MTDQYADPAASGPRSDRGSARVRPVADAEPASGTAVPNSDNRSMTAPAAQSGDRTPAARPRRGIGRFRSDLDLDGPVPPRARANIGDQGPRRVPSTGSKRRLRRWIPWIVLLAIVVVVATGYFWYLQYR